MGIRMRTIPLMLVYFVYPAVMIVVRLFGFSIPRSWIDIVWIFMGCLASFVVLMCALLRRKCGFTLNLLLVFSILWVFVGIKWGAGLFLDDNVGIPSLMGLKPFVYLWVAWSWQRAFGRLEDVDFAYYGLILGLIIIVDFVVESVILGSIARPHGSGEINYDACLLLISLIMTIVARNRSKPVLVLVIVIALMVTFSRTALAAAVVIMFAFSTIPFRMKLIGVAFAIGFIIGSFLLRDLPVGDITSMDRYWMWVAAIQMFIDAPIGVVFGFPVGLSLPVVVPDNLWALWASQSEGWGVEGIYPYNFHAMWLRLSITWGWVVVGVLIIMSLWMYPSLSDVTKALCVLVLLEGFTMGLVYLSNIGVPLFLAFMRRGEGGHKYAHGDQGGGYSFWAERGGHALYK